MIGQRPIRRIAARKRGEFQTARTSLLNTRALPLSPASRLFVGTVTV